MGPAAATSPRAVAGCGAPTGGGSSPRSRPLPGDFAEGFARASRAAGSPRSGYISNKDNFDFSDKQDFDDAGSSVTVNTVRFGPYATWKDQKGDWVDGTIGGAYHWFDSDRVALGGNATGSTTGLEFDTSTTYGHDFILGSAKQWTLTPTVGLDYVHLTVDRYAESGSIAPMIIEGQTNDSLRSSLGGTVAYATKVCGLALSPYLQAGWDHEFLDAVQAVNSRLASGAGSDFTVYGASSGHEIATFGLGVNAALTERISANLGYAGEANESFQDHSLRASLRVTF